MIKTGLCSVSFRGKTPDEIIALAVKSGIDAIEWGSDCHVPQGDVELAKEIGEKTRAAGLETPTYGSYFRLGTHADIIPFLESAKALGAKEIRIWGGVFPSAYCLPENRDALVSEAKDVAKKAAEYGIKISTECHANTITDTIESKLRFMFEVNEPNFCSYWQPLLATPEYELLPSLKILHASGKLTNLHVYHFALDKFDRDQRLLEEAYDLWLERFNVLKNDEMTRYAFLEFVRHNSDESFLSDAKTLIKLANEVNK